jgi:hypothetical protein
MRFATFGLTWGVAFAVGACGSSPASSAGDPSKPVSFHSDVIPIFQQKCAIGSSCHGDQSESPGGLQLGSGVKVLSAGDILAELVGVKAAEDPAMALVAPGSPEISFVMHKLDGDEATFASDCAASPYNQEYPRCGMPMPLSASEMPAGTRDVIRRWIAEGAINN